MISAEKIEDRADTLFERISKELDNVNWNGLDQTNFIDYDKLFEQLKCVAEKQLEEEQADKQIAAWEDNMRYTQERYG